MSEDTRSESVAAEAVAQTTMRQWSSPDATTASDTVAVTVSAPPEPEASPMDQRFTPKRLAITFMVVLAGVVGGTLVANALANDNSGNDQAMGSWMSSYGSTYLAVSHDTAAVNGSTDAKSLRAACIKLQGDVNQAQADPPMPLSSLERQWSAIIFNLSTSAIDCVKGIDEQNSDLLNTAQNHMTDAGQAYLRLVKAIQQVQ
jgi:hypothetical protein